jgi:hypothetical protein
VRDDVPLKVGIGGLWRMRSSSWLSGAGDGQNRTASFGISDGLLAPGLLCGGEIEILVEPIL